MFYGKSFSNSNQVITNQLKFKCVQRKKELTVSFCCHTAKFVSKQLNVYLKDLHCEMYEFLEIIVFKDVFLISNDTS